MVWNSNPGRGKILSLLQNNPDCLFGTPSLVFSGYPGSSIGVKWLGHDVNHSSPSSADVKNEWSYTFAPPLYLHGMDRDFTFDLMFYIQLVSLIIN